MVISRICYLNNIILLIFLTSVLFATSLAPATAQTVLLGKASPNWSEQDQRNFLGAINAAARVAARSLSTAGWKVKWNTGSKSFDNTKSTHLMYRSKGGFENSRYTDGQTRMMIRFTLYKKERDAKGNTDHLNKYYQNISQRSDKNFDYTLAQSENLGFGANSSLYVIKATSKFGTRDAPNSTATRVNAIFVSEKWQIVIGDAYNPAAVKAVMLALIEGLGRRGSVDISNRKVPPVKPKDTSDEGTIDIKLANPDDVKLGDIETNFYEVAIPSDKKLALMKEPSARSTMVVALPNGTRDIHIRKLGYVGDKKWANLCASRKCGWAIAKHLRRQSEKSSNNIGRVEVAFPEVYVFSEPTVSSRKIQSLIGGKRVALKEIITNADGDGWIRICGKGWCGWAGQDFFNPVQ